jgi:hypothetical protein
MINVRLAALLFSAVVTGCASSRYYIVEESSHMRIERASCTGQTFGYIKVPLTGDRRFEVALVPSPEGVSVSLRVGLRVGETFRLTNPVAQLQVPGQPQLTDVRFPSWRAVAYGPGTQTPYRADVPIDLSLEGRDFGNFRPPVSYNLYEATALVATKPPPERLVLRLPAVQFNGALIQPLEIVALRYENTGLSACVQ